LLDMPENEETKEGEAGKGDAKAASEQGEEGKQSNLPAAPKPSIVSMARPAKPRVMLVRETGGDLEKEARERAARDILPVARETGERIAVEGGVLVRDNEDLVDDAIRKHKARQATAEPKGAVGKFRKFLFG